MAEMAGPELIIIDVDPPQQGLVPFLEELKTSQPSVRVLAIGCGTSAKFAAARTGEGGICFLEKPFELADFGAAVNALLAHPDAPGSFARSVIDMDLADFVALGCVNGGSSIISVQASGGRLGELHFSGGQLCHALAPGLTAEAALREILGWRTPHFSELERPPDATRSINPPWDAVLIEALRQTRPHPAPTRREAPTSRPRPHVPKTGKKIVVIDDTELLLIFVEDILSTANAELQISTAHTGTEGCRRAELTAPDLILLDYSLPDINGDEVCRRLLENEKTALIPIVMMSGHVPQMTATAQRYANVVATISKPFLSHELLTLVEKTLHDGPRAVLEVAAVEAPALPPAPPPKTKQNGSGKAKAAQSKAGSAPNPPAPPAEPPAPHALAEAVSDLVIPLTTAVIIEMEPAPEPRTFPVMESLARAPIEAIPQPLDELPPFGNDDVVAAARIDEPAPLPLSTAAPALAVTLPAPKTVLVGLSLRTNAVQLTSSFQIGRIRARPTTRTVSLNFPPESSPLPAILQTGFDIDFVELNSEGQIETVRLVPTHRALEFAPESGRRFTIGEIEIGQTSSAVELTSSPASAMTIQLLGAFQIAAVELTATFAVARLVLKSISQRVRATLDGPAAIGHGVILETARVELDAAGRLAEFELTPL